MMLINAFDVFAAFLTGVLLGAFYFAGLWLTVRQLVSRRQVALLFLGSMLLRSCIVIAGFYFVLGDNWQKMLLGLLGFMAVRLVATRILRPTESSPSEKPASENSSNNKQNSRYAP